MTSSRATGATRPGCSAAIRTSHRTCRWAAAARCSAGRTSPRPGSGWRDRSAERSRSSGSATTRRVARARRHVPAPMPAPPRPTALHAGNAEPFEVRTVNWFIPDIDSPFYGGINSALRIADHLAREHGVENRFIVWGNPPDFFVRSALAAAFPELADCEIAFYDGYSGPLEARRRRTSPSPRCGRPPTRSPTPGAKRKFYLIQDFEPMFYPAGSLYALAEETYRLGPLWAVQHGEPPRIYEQDYAGKGMSFQPAVDGSVFHARSRPSAARRPRDGLPLRPARTLAELLGDRVPGPGGAEGAPGRPGPDRHRRVLGAEQDGPLTSRTWACCLPGHRRALPQQRRRRGADGLQAPVLPALGADGLRGPGRRIRQPLGSLDPPRRGRTPCSPSAP